MDPYIEPHRWEGFHTHFLVELARRLVPRVRPRYVVETEERLYVEQSGESVGTMRVDVGIDQTRRWPLPEDIESTSETAAPFLTPVVCLLPLDEELRETFLTVRDAATHEVVTVIEMLSAANKRPGSDGRAQYLRKRKLVLQSRAHLVEFDLLRGGQRLPMRTPLPEGEFFAIVSRSPRRPAAEVFAWTIRQPLPSIPIPLAGSDPDVALDLQGVLGATYDGLGYDYALDYSRPVVPPLRDADLAWARQILSKRAP
jgi:hypothetical protein